MQDLYQHLAKSPVLAKLPENELRTLSDLAVVKKLPAGEFLCHQGDLWPNAVFLLHGELRWALISLGGREQVLFRIEPGRMFWGHTMFDGCPMPASLMASKPSQLCFWTRERITPILKRCPELMWELMRLMTGTMRQAREVIYGLAFKQVAERLARVLLEQAAGQEGQPIPRELTLSEIAATVATSQEVVCRLLYQFQQDNLIELSRASFILKDRWALEELVEKK